MGRGWRAYPYYGIEHRGHLYLPGWVPHTPQSLGSGFFSLSGDDTSASVPAGGFAVGADALGSGEPRPSMAGCGTVASLSPP